ncbi:hypothetical protein CR513_28385, partial [Mucuna pruriens]
MNKPYSSKTTLESMTIEFKKFIIFNINKDVDGTTVDNTYFKQIVGSLMYLTAKGQILCIVNLISKYMSKPTELHLQAAKRILRTNNYGIFYKKGGEDLLDFMNFDYTRNDYVERRVLRNINHVQEGSTIIMCDNSSTIKLSKNPIMHGRSIHIKVDFAINGEIELVHCGTQEQVADLMTKGLKVEAFQKLKKKT